MNKLNLVFLSLLAITINVFGQTPKGSVSNAQLYIQDEDYKMAKAEIDLAVKDEKKASKAKTWMIRGDIYSMISAGQVGGMEDSIINSAALVALNSYQKAGKIDKEVGKGKLSDEVNEKINELWPGIMNQAQSAYFAQKYNESIRIYDIAIGMKPKDTTAVLFAASAAGQLQSKEGAEMMFKYVDKLFNELNYLELNPVSGKKLYYNYIYQMKTYMPDDQAKIESKLLEGMKLFPSDNQIMQELVNFYVDGKNLDKAINVLTNLVKNNPESSFYIYYLGQIYEESGDKKKALEYYKKSIDLDPDFFNAIFNVGVFYVDSANYYFKEERNMGLEESRTMGKEMIKKGKAHLETALPYFEKAYALKPKDPQTRKVLRYIYANLRMKEKLEAMKNK